MIFTIPFSPAMLRTAQQKGARVVGRHVMFYTKKEVRDVERVLVSMLRPHAGMVREIADGHAIGLSICFSFPLRKGEKVRPGRVTNPHVVRPDVDNLAKGVIDAMTAAGFWKDDSVIATLELMKYRADGEPMIVVDVWPVD